MIISCDYNLTRVINEIIERRRKLRWTRGRAISKVNGQKWENARIGRSFECKFWMWVTEFRSWWHLLNVSTRCSCKNIVEVGDQNGQICHQNLQVVPETFRLQHPSPTSLWPPHTFETMLLRLYKDYRWFKIAQSRAKHPENDIYNVGVFDLCSVSNPRSV